MFRISFFVEDKSLADVMHAVAGRVRGLEVVPVNAVAQSNGRVAPTGGNATEQVLAMMRTRKITTFTIGQLAEIVQAVGYTPASAGYYAKNLKNMGVVKMHGGKGSSKASYELLPLTDKKA